MRTTPALVLTCTIALLTGGCSAESLKRFAYAVGAQQACAAANEDHVYESLEDLQCSAKQGTDDLSYDAYTAAREQALDENQAL